MKDTHSEHTADGAASAPRVGKEADAPIDDGRTVSPMTAEWMPWNAGRTVPGRTRKEKEEKGGEERSGRKGETLTKEEKRAMPTYKATAVYAMLRGAFMAHLPVIGGLALVAAVLFGLACLWLMPH